MSNIPLNTDDLIDSRDIIQAITDLRDWIASETDPDCLADYKANLAALEALADEAEPESSDWECGETLIARSYWVEYITDLIHDCYEMPKEMNSGKWPYRHITIDYEAAARDAEHDYASVDFDGVEYLIRSC